VKQPTAAAAKGGLERRLLDVGHDDPHTLLGEPRREAETDSASRAGDHRDPA